MRWDSDSTLCCAGGKLRPWKSEMSNVPTASQTVGPFFSIGLVGMCRTELQAHASAGENISVRGRVLDGDGQPVPDAMLEIWHADGDGKYDSRTAANRESVAGVPAGFGL